MANGLVDVGFTQIFVLPVDGGTPRQLTYAERNHDGRLSFSPDGKTLLFSANAEDDWEYNPQNSDLYSLDVASGAIKRLTTRVGPDDGPAMSPNGKLIAYTGFDEKNLSYQVTDLYVANADGSNPRLLTANFDRDVASPQWAGDGAIWFRYEEQGLTKLARIAPTGGKITTVATDLMGAAVDRPYSGGEFSVNRAGRYAATVGDSARPSDVALFNGTKATTLTNLNSDVFTGKQIPSAELLTTPSSFDKRPIEAWVVKPPNFDPAKRYPMLLEIHGGPHTAYGPAFAAEAQMYAAAGYVVVYSNPRGSTSYGGEFGNLIHHNYPSQDYDDLMSVTDAVIAKYSDRHHQALRHRRFRRRRADGVDRRHEQPLRRRHGAEAGDQLDQPRSLRRWRRVLRPLLVRREAVGARRAGALLGPLAALEGRQCENAHRRSRRRGRQPHAPHAKRSSTIRPCRSRRCRPNWSSSRARRTISLAAPPASSPRPTTRSPGSPAMAARPFPIR